MTTLKLQLPDSLKAEQEDTIRFLAAKLYESHKLSLGQAAEVAGLSKWGFAETLINYDVGYFQYSGEDFINEPKKLPFKK
jgi:predicted HTH domain antitoxin